MAVPWPPVNTRAWLRLPCCGAEHPTRVEDFKDENCIIGAPIAPHPQPVSPLDRRQGFFMGWISERGEVEVPVSLVTHFDNPVAMWSVKAIGEPEITQRRNFVRMAYEGLARLFLHDGGAAVEASILDLSEGGIRCQIDEWAIDPGDRHFKIELPFEKHTFYMRGQIAWWGRLDNQGWRVVGVKFTGIETIDADAIRSYVFAKQLEERRRRYS